MLIDGLLSSIHIKYLIKHEGDILTLSHDELLAVINSVDLLCLLLELFLIEWSKSTENFYV